MQEAHEALSAEETRLRHSLDSASCDLRRLREESTAKIESLEREDRSVREEVARLAT